MENSNDRQEEREFTQSPAQRLTDTRYYESKTEFFEANDAGTEEYPFTARIDRLAEGRRKRIERKEYRNVAELDRHMLKKYNAKPVKIREMYAQYEPEFEFQPPEPPKKQYRPPMDMDY